MTVEMFKLKPWQKAVFDLYTNYPDNHWFIIKARRQCGKSICLEGLLIVASLTKGGSFSLFVSPVIQQARKVYQDVCRIASDLIKSANGSLLEIEFINGSIIKFGSGQQADSLRGYTIKGSGVLMVDEAAYIADNVFYSILVPTTNVNHSNIFIVSTPKLKQGFFYELFIRGLADTKVVSIDWNDYDTSDMLDSETLELYKQQMPKLAFQSEFLAEFIDGEGTVFTNFKKCIGSSNYVNSPFYIGIDWCGNTGNDNTAISVGQVIDSKLVVSKIIAFNDKTSNETIAAIKDLVLKLKNINTDINIVCEKNSIGNVFYQLLIDELDGIAECSVFTTTNKSKDKIVKQLMNVFEQDKIVIPDDKDLIVELSAYECKPSPTGLPTYNAPNGFHDDRVMSLCILLNSVYYELQ